MDRIDEFAKSITGIDYFIASPYDFLYKYIEEPTNSEIIECLRFIILNNQQVLDSKQNKLNSLKTTISNSKPLSKPLPSIIKETTYQIPSPKKQRNLKEAIDYVTYSSEQELTTFLSKLNEEDLIRIKLSFLKIIISLRQKIKETILNNPLSNIESFQQELTDYENILKRLKEYTTKKESLQVEETISPSKIVILPSSNSSYLLEDINMYKERAREIKNAFDKIVDGYFLQTKDLKTIEGQKEKVCEYRNPNGIRILYIIKDNLIYVCSLFFKDKQKSIRISNEYDEAERRFLKSFTYVQTNYQNPDFHIEQAEIIGQIYEFLESNITLTKKMGDRDE